MTRIPSLVLTQGIITKSGVKTLHPFSKELPLDKGFSLYVAEDLTGVYEINAYMDLIAEEEYGIDTIEVDELGPLKVKYDTEFFKEEEINELANSLEIEL